MSTLEIRGLKVTVDTEQGVKEILKGVDLTIKSGETHAIMGPNGSGKSTLMNMLGCLDQPTSGQYLLSGEAVHAMSSDALASLRNRKIGFVFQQLLKLKFY